MSPIILLLHDSTMMDWFIRLSGRALIIMSNWHLVMAILVIIFGDDVVTIRLRLLLPMVLWIGNSSVSVTVVEE